ncbi:MAG: hypothetical protein SGILL_003072 [Bacillariaceae sp.]
METSEDQPVARTSKSMDTSDGGHALLSSAKGKSDIETLARAMQERRSNRTVVTFKERKEFLDICYDVAKQEGGSPNRFSKEGLLNLVNEYQERVTKKENVTTSTIYKIYNGFFNLLGFWDSDQQLLKLFKAGLEYLERGDEDEFYFRDFNFYQLEIKTRFSFMRIPQFAVFFWLIVYYLGSAILFCSIMKNPDVCEVTPYAYGGWLSSIYFASVTMSTVGYVARFCVLKFWCYS